MKYCALALPLVLAACGSRPSAIGPDGWTGRESGNPGLTDRSSSADFAPPAKSPDLAPAPTVAWRTQVSGTKQNLHGIWGSSATDIYVVGDGGTILHSSSGGTWTAQTSGTTKRLNAVWGSSAADLYIAGEDIVLRSGGDGNWRSEIPPGAEYRAVWGSGAGDVYIAGIIGIARSTGDGSWISQPPSKLTRAYFGLGGRGASDVWAVGGDGQTTIGQLIGGAERFTGSWSWTALGTPYNMKGVAFTAAGTFIVGNGGQIWFDGGSGFTQQASSNVNDLNGVWTSKDGTLFAVGGSGSVVTSSGDGKWSNEKTPSALPLDAVWGVAPLDLYAVGFAGEILHRSAETH